MPVPDRSTFESVYAGACPIGDRPRPYRPKVETMLRKRPHRLRELAH